MIGLPVQVKNPTERPVILTYIFMVFFALLSMAVNPAGIFGGIWIVLFVWLFGRAVEGRLGLIKFTLLTVATALLGGLLHHVFTDVQTLNADTDVAAACAVVGLAAAYLYMFPYAYFRAIYWYPVSLFHWECEVKELQTWPMILVYLAVEAFLLAHDLIHPRWYYMRGTGYYIMALAAMITFPCLALGYVITWRMHPKRDSEAYAIARATVEDSKDTHDVPLADLEELMQNPLGDVDLIMGYLERMDLEAKEIAADKYAPVIAANWDVLFERADTAKLAKYVLLIPIEDHIPAVFQLLRLGHRLESVHSFTAAAKVYQRIYQSEPAGQCTESALMRLAVLYETQFGDIAQAKAVLIELIHEFPNGEFVLEAQDLLDRLKLAVGSKSSRLR